MLTIDPNASCLRYKRWGRVLSGFLTIAALTSMGGCFGGDGPVVSLKSDEAAGRIPAMQQAAKRKDKSAYPDLIANLNDDDPAVRFYAIESLRRMTGQTLGYRYFEDETHRQESVQRWKDWLKKEKY